VSKTKVIDNLLSLDVEDHYYSVVLDPRKPSTEANLETNRTDTNDFKASPSISYAINPAMTLTAGYRYTNIWYRESDSINRQMHTGFASLQNAFSPTLTAALGVEYMADRPEDP
jgi:uncharacterized protein (PEP-CTERM system associated)